MDAATKQQDMKKCPACAELILADAIKCKHCGERLDRPKRPTIPALSPEKRKKVLVAGAVVLAVAVLGGLGWLAYSRVPETKLWVSMHKDVEWHRGWQDARVEDQRTRVADLYRELSGANPADGNLTYLALRTLPDGEKKLREFRDAAKKFEKNPWVIYGLAGEEEEAGNDSSATENRMKAITLFGDQVPARVYGTTAVGLARAGDVEGLKELFAKHADRFRGSSDLSLSMAKVAFFRGDLEGMVKWEENAEKVGRAGHVARDLKQAVEAIGLRPDIIGQARTAPGVMDVEVKEFSAEQTKSVFSEELDAAEGATAWTRLVLRLKVTSHVWSENLHLYLGNAAIVPSSGAGLKSTSNRSTDIPPGKSVEVGISFLIPTGKTVEKFVLDTGRVRLPYETPILVTMDLRPDPSFKVENPIRP